MIYLRYVQKRWLGHTVAAPFIWAPLFVFILFDLLGEIYHQICFPLYGLEKVNRSEYIQIRDRFRLPYLSIAGKLSCAYCGYINGGLLYYKEIAGRTEKYWCGIMHENKPGFKIQEHQLEQGFSRYGDEKDFINKYIAK
ncbi:MAG: hypothetical protein UT48_C0005G0002 [Parcubacteria group bacterium GW2011_GWE2_39_37]|nr:MAG: hypothetical protein UT48_C0005G0002 [Parcubacteria group bacterium GW2011_GWE2_39_37]